ncbi:glycerol-3-phosphate dehydrogenase (NAD(+)) [Cryptococcus wingfieldii CBS 7118]|uniref:Glycerol-3-phosphate dehydrogenase [NAD(+)] n=1 Tax=Cryptococcus wingfieldii CBS 7118 TaxID=1295528 RepID=A0A1E3K9I8_9TREE|nr:glycerol-3-phosphate dehydrogenase (NAD(+)) [Cryptococcus wingfieldii CBS 7118]ODO08912.1 glycerol-3-phosphate dehydrogenase (NAD(+)) [Cryptococcus wingfieldii CBS 7118]
MPQEKVAIIGSGNWGTAIARLAGINTAKHTDVFDGSRVPMWVFEEEFEGKKLTEVINTEHENKKYLPGIKLAEHIVAVPDLLETVKDATALVFVTPHQFLGKLLDQLEGHVRKDAKAITLIKGVDVRGADIHIFADVIEKRLGIPTSALSGANIANEVAKDTFSETTIGYRSKADGELWQKLFQTPKFKVQLIDDVAGVSLCGALKNIVAVAAGFCDGLGYGSNTKAAIMRIGLLEMKHFCQEFFDDVKEESFLQESAGVADVITTCLAGRNCRVAKAFVGSGKTFDQLEEEMLNGQRLQGTLTAKEIHEFLHAKGKARSYPLFDKVYQIAWEGVDPEQLTEGL